MWVNKYAPQKTSDLIGNQQAVMTLRSWLQNWSASAPTSSEKKKNPHKKAILLSGPPGIGKTSSAMLVAKELGYITIEFNASDARSKKKMEDNGFLDMSKTRGIEGFFGKDEGEQQHNSDFQKKVIIMDEVDGMSGSDRGGNAALIKVIKTTRVPIICICNDRYKNTVKSLAKHCLDIRFKSPDAFLIARKIQGIMAQEGFIKVDIQTLTNLCGNVNNDIRQILNLVQVLRLKTNKLEVCDLGKFASEMANSRSSKVDSLGFTRHLFDTKSRHNLSEDLRLFCGGDYMSIPAFVHWNFFEAKTQRSRVYAHDLMNSFLDGLDYMSLGDVMTTHMLEQQTWSLLPHVAIVTTLAPSHCARRCLNPYVKFPGSFGKISTRNKNVRVLKEMYPKFSRVTLSGPLSVKAEYLPHLSHIIISILTQKGKDGIDEVVKIMQTYDICRSDLDLIFEICMTTNSWKSVPGNVKAALTRMLKKIEVGPTFPKRKKMKLAHPRKKPTNVNKKKKKISIVEDVIELPEKNPRKRKNPVSKKTQKKNPQPTKKSGTLFSYFGRKK